MRRGNEQFRALVNAAPIAVVGPDLEDRINVWNPAAERLFGWRPEEVLGKTVPIIPPDRKEEGLTDVLMPGLRGPEVARLVSQRHPGVHVVYMSGDAEGPRNAASFEFRVLAEAISICNSPRTA